MARINTCLKWTFMAYSVLVGILGSALLALALLTQFLSKTHAEMEGRAFGLISVYVMGGVTLAIAILGVYGARKENKAALIAFLVTMVCSVLLMLLEGVPTAATRPQVEPIMEKTFRRLTPLDRASDELQEVVGTLQTQFQCCGLFGPGDWRDKIPQSCFCSGIRDAMWRGKEEEVNCLRVPQFLQGEQPVNTKPCFPIIMGYIMMVYDIVIGILFALAVLAFLGMILSSAMIHQLRSSARPPVLMTIPSIFIGGQPKYQELASQPPNYQEFSCPPPKYQELADMPPKC